MEQNVWVATLEELYQPSWGLVDEVCRRDDGEGECDEEEESLH